MSRRSPAFVSGIPEEVFKMRQADIIKESDSPHASHMVCVPKPNGQLCVFKSFQLVIKYIVKDVYKMHCIYEKLKAISGTKVFTTIDLKKGCHQLILHPNSNLIIFFSSPDGLFLWKVIPLGIKTVCTVSKRIMHRVAGDL